MFQVIGDRRWKEITAAFKFPTSITSASFVLRKYYLSLLYHFEQVYYFRKEEPSIIAAGTFITWLWFYFCTTSSFLGVVGNYNTPKNCWIGQNAVEDGTASDKLSGEDSLQLYIFIVW